MEGNLLVLRGAMKHPTKLDLEQHPGSAAKTPLSEAGLGKDQKKP